MYLLSWFSDLLLSSTFPHPSSLSCLSFPPLQSVCVDWQPFGSFRFALLSNCIASHRSVHRFDNALNSNSDACMSSSLVSSSLSPSAIGSFGGGSAAFFANAPPARPEANYIYDLAPASSSSGSSGQNAPSTSNQFPYYSQQQMIDNCAAYAKRLRERQQHERYGTFDEQDSS